VTQHPIQEDSDAHQHCCENLIFCKKM